MAASRQVTTVLEQLAVWSGERDGPAFFVDLVERLPADVPDPLRRQLEERASAATEALASFRRYLLDEYGPKAEGTPDPVGADRYKVWARYFNGTDLDLTDAYAYGWDEFKRLHAEMEAEAERVLPGSTPKEAMAHLDEVGPFIESEVVLREWLSGLVLEAMASPRRPALRPGARAAARGGSDRSAGRRRGAVLLVALPRLQPARHHLVPDAGQDALHDVGARVDLVPRGRPGPPPAARAVGAAVRGAVPLPGHARDGQRQRRGVGALRRAPHGRARVLPGSGPPARLPGGAADAAPCGW